MNLFLLHGEHFLVKEFEEIVQSRLLGGSFPLPPWRVPGRVMDSVEQSLESVDGSVIFRTFRSHLCNTIKRMKRQEIIHAH